MAKYIIFNADDGGARHDITQAIVESFFDGLLRSTSVLINHVSDSDVEVFKSATGLGLGLHTNLATGEPLSENWRQKYGNFVYPDPCTNRVNYTETYTQDAWINMFSKFQQEDIEQELVAQIERFRQLFHVLPTHLDSHYNTYAVENMFHALVAVAKEYELPIRRPVVYTKNDKELTSNELEDSDAYGAWADENGILMTDAIYLPYLNLKEDYIGEVLSVCDELEDGEIVEIPLHPGFKESWREKYVEIMKDENLAEALTRANIESISYADISQIRRA
jgi:predicted glycoside hydrolase/deacetylase ChbG (UPF0249 family)